MKRIKYSLLVSDNVLIDPQMSVWINSNNFVLHVLFDENNNFCYLLENIIYKFHCLLVGMVNLSSCSFDIITSKLGY